MGDNGKENGNYYRVHGQIWVRYVTSGFRLSGGVAAVSARACLAYHSKWTFICVLSTQL